MKHEREFRRRVVDTVGALLRKRFEQATRQTYNAVGHDVWHGDTPDEGEFVDVIREHVDVHGGLSRPELAAFHALSLAEQRRIILTAL